MTSTNGLKGFVKGDAEVVRMMITIGLILLAALVGVSGKGASFFEGWSSSNDLAQDILPVDRAFARSDYLHKGQLHVNWRIESGYYLYQKRLKLSTSSGRDLTLILPEGLPFQDEYFGDVIIYRSELSVVFDVDRMDRDLEDGKVLLEYQGCADAGYCYPPQKHWIALW